MIHLQRKVHIFVGQVYHQKENDVVHIIYIYIYLYLYLRDVADVASSKATNLVDGICRSQKRSGFKMWIHDMANR